MLDFIWVAQQNCRKLRTAALQLVSLGAEGDSSDPQSGELASASAKALDLDRPRPVATGRGAGQELGFICLLLWLQIIILMLI